MTENIFPLSFSLHLQIEHRFSSLPILFFFPDVAWTRAEPPRLLQPVWTRRDEPLPGREQPPLHRPEPRVPVLRIRPHAR